MRLLLKIFCQLSLLIFYGICIVFLLQKSQEINQANKIIRDFNRPYTISQENYTKEQHEFTTVIHVHETINPFVCERIIRTRLPYPHLFYVNGKLLDTASKNACKYARSLSLQFDKSRNSFAHNLECVDNSTCKCVYGFCKNRKASPKKR